MTSTELLFVLGVSASLAMLAMLALLLAERAKRKAVETKIGDVSDEAISRLVTNLPKFRVGFDEVSWGVAPTSDTLGKLFLSVTGKVGWKDDEGREHVREQVCAQEVSRETITDSILSVYLILVLREAIANINAQLVASKSKIAYPSTRLVLNGNVITIGGDGTWTSHRKLPRGAT